MKKQPFLLQIVLVTGLLDITLTSLLPPIQSCSSKFQYGLLLLVTLIRGGGGITSTRSWTGHLCQNTVQCLRYFCNWVQTQVINLSRLGLAVVESIYNPGKNTQDINATAPPGLVLTLWLQIFFNTINVAEGRGDSRNRLFHQHFQAFIAG